MKKSKLAMMVICVIALVSCSIEDNIELESQKNLKALSRDTKFLSSVQASFDLLDGVVDVEKIQSLIENPNLGESDVNELSKAMGFDDYASYEAYMADQKNKYDMLEKEYNLTSYSNEELTNTAISALTSSILVKRASSDDCNCERIRINCNVEVAAAALIANWGVPVSIGLV